MNHSKAFRILGPVTAAVAVAAVAVLVAGLGRTQASSAVPWLDHPVKIPVATAARTDVARCAAGSVSVRLERRGIVQDGIYAYVYGVRNTGHEACSVSGYPRLTVAGKAVAHGPDVLSVAPGNLRPGQVATFALTQTVRPGCTANSRNGILKQVAKQVDLAIGTRRPGAIGQTLVSKCTKNSVSALGLAPAEPRADALSRLLIRLKVPALATAGQTLRFQVVLTNPTRAAIRLSPCPSYEVGISVAGEHAFELNCADPVIAAGHSRRFEMEYPVPAGARKGLAKIGWLLLDPRRTGSGTIVRIVS
ncbi:MAG TPA: DUF4232 domain-containing protein [Trebonia sp.]|jgi:hypothetical protein|nr:DUF4232 domain-containing protein [Trebonia sp.]